MDALTAVAGLVAIGAITPGPNNYLVMRAAARSGLRGALPAIVGIVLGGLALLAVVVTGGGALFEAAPFLRTAIAFAGCLYLSWSGLGLVARAGRETEREADGGLPEASAGVASLFVFQFLNPKSWVLVLTAASATRPSSSWLGLAALLVLIPAPCLVAWSSLGSLLTRALRRRTVRVWFDRATGVLLIASAILLWVEA